MSFQVVVISLQTMNEAMENGSQVTYQDEDVLDPRPKAIPILARNGLDFNPNISGVINREDIARLEAENARMLKEIEQMRVPLGLVGLEDINLE